MKPTDEPVETFFIDNGQSFHVTANSDVTIEKADGGKKFKVTVEPARKRAIPLAKKPTATVS